MRKVYVIKFPANGKYFYGDDGQKGQEWIIPFSLREARRMLREDFDTIRKGSAKIYKLVAVPEQKR